MPEETKVKVNGRIDIYSYILPEIFNDFRQGFSQRQDKIIYSLCVCSLPFIFQALKRKKNIFTFPKSSSKCELIRTHNITQSMVRNHEYIYLKMPKAVHIPKKVRI